SLVVDILTNGGDPNPRWQQRLFWAILEGVIAAVLLIAGATTDADALDAIQTASIAAGLPFCIVLIAMSVGLVRGLAHERVAPPRAPEPGPLAGLREAAERRKPPRAAAEEQQLAEEEQAIEEEQGIEEEQATEGG